MQISSCSMQLALLSHRSLQQSPYSIQRFLDRARQGPLPVGDEYMGDPTGVNHCLHPCLYQMLGRRWIKNALGIWQHGRSKVFISTIDNQNLPRDEAGRITEQENCRVGDIPGISFATQGKERMVMSGGALR